LGTSRHDDVDRNRQLLSDVQKAVAAAITASWASGAPALAEPGTAPTEAVEA
jgi:hypothetical protein